MLRIWMDLAVSNSRLTNSWRSAYASAALIFSAGVTGACASKSPRNTTNAITSKETRYMKPPFGDGGTHFQPQPEQHRVQCTRKIQCGSVVLFTTRCDTPAVTAGPEWLAWPRTSPESTSRFDSRSSSGPG